MFHAVRHLLHSTGGWWAGGICTCAYIMHLIAWFDLINNNREAPSSYGKDTYDNPHAHQVAS